MEKWTWGIQQYGAHGLADRTIEEEDAEAEEENVDAIGIDWEALADNRVRERVYAADDADVPHLADPPANMPRDMAHVPCEPSNCPLDEENLRLLFEQISDHFPEHTEDRLTLRRKWILGLRVCRELSDEF